MAILQNAFESANDPALAISELELIHVKKDFIDNPVVHDTTVDTKDDTTIDLQRMVVDRRPPLIIRLVESIHPQLTYAHAVIPLAVVASVLATPGTSFGAGSYTRELTAALNIGKATYGICWIVALMASAIFIPLAGRAIDKFGPKSVALISAPFYAITMLWMANVDSVVKLTGGFFLMRLFMAIWQQLAGYLVNQWWVTRKAYAMTIFCVFGASGLAYPSLAALLIKSVGWRESYVWQSILIATLCTLIGLAIVRRPEDVGRLTDGRRQEPGMIPVSTTDELTMNLSQNENENEELHWRYVDAIRTKTFWAVTLTSCTTALFWSSYNFYFRQVFHSHNIEDSVADWSFSLVAISDMVGMMMGGYMFSFLVTKSRGMIASTISCALSILFILYGRTTFSVVLFSIFYGIYDGLYFNSYALIFAFLFGRVELASIDGLASGLNTVACGIGPLIGGWLEDSRGDLDPLFIFVLSSCIVTTLVFFCLQNPTPPPKERLLKVAGINPSL